MKVLDTPKGPIRRSHCIPLSKSGRSLQATDIAKGNAFELAKGYCDLVLLTLEPGDNEDKVRHDQSGGVPRTIEILNEHLEAVSDFRTWQNTCIIDARSYRSAQIRQAELCGAREARDEIAYEGCESSIEKLQPDLLIVLQSSTGQVCNDFVRTMSSSTSSCGSVFLYQLRSSKWMVVVHSLHPMYAEKYTEGRDPMIRRLRRAMIRFSFLQAINILSGRMIVGAGVQKLRDAVWGAGQTPHLLMCCGTLNPSLDRRSKGVFLSPNATPEMKKIWNECMSQRKSQVSTMTLCREPGLTDCSNKQSRTGWEEFFPNSEIDA